MKFFIRKQNLIQLISSKDREELTIMLEKVGNYIFYRKTLTVSEQQYFLYKSSLTYGKQNIDIVTRFYTESHTLPLNILKSIQKKEKFLAVLHNVQKHISILCQQKVLKKYKRRMEKLKDASSHIVGFRNTFFFEMV